MMTISNATEHCNTRTPLLCEMGTSELFVVAHRLVFVFLISDEAVLVPYWMISAEAEPYVGRSTVSYTQRIHGYRESIPCQA